MAEGLFSSCLAEVLSHLKSEGNNFVLKPQQSEALRQLFDGKDLVAVLPTGYGKSLIFQLLVLINQRRNVKLHTSMATTLLVISPLTSIIEDQIKEVSSMGITACSLVEKLDDLGSIRAAKYSIVYASPEAATTKQFLELLKDRSSPFRQNIVGCVVDESHTVETWSGLRSSSTAERKKTKKKTGVAFRSAFGELAILRSFLPEGTPFAALTGTADDNTLEIISTHLAMKDPLIVRISPNRENVRFRVVKAKKEHLLSELNWLIDCIRSNALATPKCIVFCNTMNEIACVANYLMLKLGKAAYFPTESRNSCDCLVGIYHSSSWAHNKERVAQSLKGNGKIRVVVSSTALSMGVNFPDIRYIINWGPARNLLDQHQEIGRAGRDGLPSHSIVLYYGQQLSQCEQDVKDFVKADGCLRVAAYKPLDPEIKPLQPLHSCCASCSAACKCAGAECRAEKLPFEELSNHVELEEKATANLSRPVSEDDRHGLREALKEVGTKMSLKKGISLLDSVASHGFSSELIEDVVKNCSKMFTTENILDNCPVFSIDHALLILEVLQEVFLDIPNFDETMDILRQANFTSDTVTCLKEFLDSVDLSSNAPSSESEEELEDDVLI